MPYGSRNNAFRQLPQSLLTAGTNTFDSGREPLKTHLRTIRNRTGTAEEGSLALFRRVFFIPDFIAYIAPSNVYYIRISKKRR